MNNINTNFDEEISLVDILKFFLKNFKMITIFTLLFFLTGIIIFFIISPPKGYYITESAIIVLGTKSDVNIGKKEELFDVVKSLADIYPPRLEDRKKTVAAIVKSPLIISLVLDKAKEQLQKKNLEITLESFVSEKSDLLKIQQTGEIIKINVKFSDKELAKFFADEIAKVTVEYARKELYFDLPLQQQEKLVKIAYLSILPEKPQDGKKKSLIFIFLFMLIGFFTGTFFSLIKDAYYKIRQQI
ncbi:MAG: hypothetical protein ACK4WJ_02710 [Endomicrobiia bacterium]